MVDCPVLFENLHIQDGRYGTSVILPHCYCIGNKILIVEGEEFHIRYANIRSSYVIKIALVNVN